MLSLSEALENLANLPLISNMFSGDFFNSTVMGNIWSLICFTVGYVILFIMLPAKILNLKLCDGKFFENAMISVIVSQVTIILAVFLLAFLKIYNYATLVITLILVVLIYRKIRYKVSYIQKGREFLYKFSDLITGQLKLSIILSDFLNNRINYMAGAVKRFFKFFFDKNVVYHIICTLTLLVLAVRRCYFCITSQAFPSSDISVHITWIKFLDAGNIFYDGVYPFGMHNLVSAFAKLTFSDVVTVMRFWGSLNAILFFATLLIFLSKFFKSPAAYTVVSIIYCVSDFANLDISRGYVTDRLYYSLPQEYGMLFIFPTAYFMIKFFEEKKTTDAVVFAMAASMTVAAHFYNAIFAIPLCICLGLPYVTRVFKKDVIGRFALSLLLAAALCLGPLFAGRALGYNWNGSLDWAISVMDLGDDSSSEEVVESEETEEVAETEESEETEEETSFVQNVINALQWNAEAVTSFWGYVMFICAGITMVAGIAFMCVKSLRSVGRVSFGLGLNVFVMCLLVLYPENFGLPAFIDNDRAINYFVYIGCALFGVPLGMLWNIFEEKVKPVRWVGSVAGVLAIAIFVVFTGSTYQSSLYYRLSYSAVTENYYKIKNSHEDYTWTIVSTYDELALTRNVGWHYELWEFIFSLEQYQSTTVVQIPTEYVYFVIEKRPLEYNSNAWLGEDPLPESLISYTSAKQLLTEELVGFSSRSDYYTDYETRKAIMSKAYYWAEQYMQYFPDQMSVYYEDDDIIIYEIVQNVYALNNFAIDYGYNTTTLEQWLQLHPDALESGDDDESE